MVLATPSPTGSDAIPPFETGDRLSREEFERRWALHPEIKRAERINGMVFVQLSVHRSHSRANGRISAWLGIYAASRNELEALPDTTVRLEDDDLQPDILLRYLAGGSIVGEDDCIHGAPELVVEVSASSVSYDLHDKKALYRRSGVQEYLVWQVFENKIDWWQLVEGEYVSIDPDADGVIESLVFPGLRLNREAMLNDDMAAVLAAL